MPQTHRTRRSPGQARADIVAAATEAFQDAGFHGASLRSIAGRAGTTQAVLYRYFPSKSDLFRESILKPFEDFFLELLEPWVTSPVPDLPTEELMANFTAALYDFAVAHRRLLLTLIAADTHSDEGLDEIKSAFSSAIDGVRQQVMAERVERGWEHVDIEVAAPATVAMILSTALLSEWLFPPSGKKLSRQRIVDELVRYEFAATTREP